MTDLTGIGAVFDLGGKVIDRLWPDPLQRDRAKLEMLRLQQEGAFKELELSMANATAQLQVNTEEAKNSNVFVSGWRPAVGWVCVSACAWNWIGLPVVSIILKLSGHDIPLAPADLSEMLPVLAGMLGLGWMRTHEKVKGVAG